MNGPLVSVIVPTFNRAPLLAEALDSVLAQSYPRFELIVVDDGSEDGTPEVLARIGDPRLAVIRQANRGVSAARNRGASAAAGSLLAFLDSDDLWHRGKLQRQVEFLRSRPAAAIGQCEELWIRDGRRVNPGMRHRKRSGLIFEPSLERCLVSPSATMLKRTLFEAMGGFDEALPACEDYDLWLRIGCRHPIHLLPEPLVTRRAGHPDQLSRAPALDRHRIRSLLRLFQGQDLTPVQRRAVGGVLRRKCAIFAAGCARRGRTAEAADYRRLAAACGVDCAPDGQRPIVMHPERNPG
jgi:glycosyltransferase involved in cell wall biosynthesis